MRRLILSAFALAAGIWLAGSAEAASIGHAAAIDRAGAAPAAAPLLQTAQYYGHDRRAEWRRREAERRRREWRRRHHYYRR